MRHLKVLIFGFIILLLKVNCDEEKKVVNTCSNLGYSQPSSPDDCKEEDEICCYVEIEDENNGVLKFCVSSPSDIEMDDVKDEIKSYTGYSLKQLKCNESQFLFHNLFQIFALSIFMLI